MLEQGPPRVEPPTPLRFAIPGVIVPTRARPIPQRHTALPESSADRDWPQPPTTTTIAGSHVSRPGGVPAAFAAP
jgi:hypothetical protein